MIGGKAQAAQRPTALGTMLQASTYGMAVPTIYGMTQSPLLAIWAANLRKGSGSTKKLKQFLKKQPVYVEGVDFLVGKNPIIGVNRIWINGGKIPLQIKTATFSTFSFGTTEFTIADPYFYSIIGVTFARSYSASFNDYGAPGGAVTVSGTANIPLWNLCEQGPNPTNPNSYRKWPLCYRWQPSYGPTLYMDSLRFGGPVSGPGSITVTYFQLMEATSYEAPLAKYRMAFEAELGSGDEYSENNASAQQIVYPMFAGIGSPDIDLGTSATMPQIQAETKGKFGYWPTGDADYADIIEDVVRSGIAQAAIGAPSGTAFTGLEHGLSGYDFPGCVQKRSVQGVTGPVGTSGPIPFFLPNTAGNFLVVVLYGGTAASGVTISDTSGNTWTSVLPSSGAYQVFWARAVGGVNAISLSAALQNDWEMAMFEIAGVDSFDVSAVGAGSGAAINVTTSNQSGFPVYLLAGEFFGATPGPGLESQWAQIISDQTLVRVWERRANSPSTFSFVPAAAALASCVLAFKCANPPVNPKPVGGFLDPDSLDQVRLQCAAYGLYGSLTMTNQQSASDWLKQLYQAANAAPVYLGSKLFSIPLSEASAAGNGSTYVSPTASGPVMDLDADNGDFVGTAPQIKVTTADRTQLNNVLQMQCISRDSDYNQVVVSQPDAAAIALYGVRKGDPVVNNAVQDASIARLLLGIAVRNNQYGGDTYDFTLNARKGSLLAPLDLVTVTDSLAGIVGVPVRLTSITEQENGSFECQAAPFVYGMNAPTTMPVSVQPVTTPDANVDPGPPNAPIFIEPVPRLANIPNGYELWIAVSGAGASYAGCQAFISTDGGASYSPLGDPIAGSAITGESTADWPAAADPDTTNNLALDLTESNGTLASYPVSDEDAFKYPCYVAGGGASTIPYELMTYAVATLTAANKYTLEATGTGNKLRRAVFAAPAVGEGCDHPSGSRFAFLSPDGAGILKVPMDSAWIGVELYFKFVPFNSFGNSGQQSLSSATAYTFTPTGGSGAINPAGVAVQSFQVNGA